jgi:hypothetical protein
MPSLVGLLFAIRVSSLAAPAPPAPYASLSFREEARLVAQQTVTGARAGRVEGPYVAAADAPSAAIDTRPLLRPDRRLRAGDVAVVLMRQLHVDETPIGKIAVWVVTRPVQVDWSPHHVYVRATIVGP